MDGVVDQRSWLKDLGQCQRPVRVGDRDESNMKALAHGVSELLCDLHHQDPDWRDRDMTRAGAVDCPPL
jgi:hypothetical protein